MPESADQIIAIAISHLEGQAERLRSLDLTDPLIVEVVCRSNVVLGSYGPLWLLKHNKVLQAIPLDLVLSGQSERVLNALGQIEYGTAV
ncbi:hypothetical protein [Microvirga arsenatis]|uniref:DUF2384 domain-containing protein n=1 Tax=Microvirga arsenatis TaxID=2692265 RepID=A0ABW9Z3Y2_9HYPH|nr:hypothetical protein [Microvirga arsenatis]NBJ12984.1 hypothetical protein [Microvirga arsenatis]NBJ26792.1 hypothetical protein [Microvirga arsenatis]